MTRNWHDDPFTKKARNEDFLARSVYKLEEIDKREKLLDGAKIILDLGASPGSWTQYCLKRIAQDGKVYAIDLNPIKVNDPRLTKFEGDMETFDFDSVLDGKKADVVLSDMAPKTSGIRDRDVALSSELAELALRTAARTLKPGGHFVVKIFMGDSFEDFDKLMKQNFKEVKKLRPESTRKHSKEIFFIGKNFISSSAQ